MHLKQTDKCVLKIKNIEKKMNLLIRESKHTKSWSNIWRYGTLGKSAK